MAASRYVTEHVWDFPFTHRKIDMPFEYEAVRAKTQQTLIDFLHNQLKFGLTLAQSASLSAEAGHLNHYGQAKRNATKATEVVRRFVSQVADKKVRTQIASELAELDRLISVLPMYPSRTHP
jgi:hypothetical protein